MLRELFESNGTKFIEENKNGIITLTMKVPDGMNHKVIKYDFTNGVYVSFEEICLHYLKENGLPIEWLPKEMQEEKDTEDMLLELFSGYYVWEENLKKLVCLLYAHDINVIAGGKKREWLVKVKW